MIKEPNLNKIYSLVQLLTARINLTPKLNPLNHSIRSLSKSRIIRPQLVSHRFSDLNHTIFNRNRTLRQLQRRKKQITLLHQLHPFPLLPQTLNRITSLVPPHIRQPCLQTISQMIYYMLQTHPAPNILKRLPSHSPFFSYPKRRHQSRTHQLTVKTDVDPAYR